MKHLFSTFLLLPLLYNAQTKAPSLYETERGRVFPSVAKYPGQRLERSGLVVVRRSLYGVTFKDTQIPETYKKAVEKFFKKAFKGYTALKTYRLKVERYEGSLWIEGVRID